MMRRYVNFIFARDWNYLFPEEEVKFTNEGMVAKRTAPNGGVIEINMALVAAVERFERDFEAAAEARKLAEERERGE